MNPRHIVYVVLVSKLEHEIKAYTLKSGVGPKFGFRN